jgi:cytidyltransferase-like protein
MKNYIVQLDKKTSSTDKQYSMFIGRWQPFHLGHQWLFNQALQDGKRVLVCIRDVTPDERNPYSPEEVKHTIEEHYGQLVTDEWVKVMVIPDIESVNWGRGVGYELIEHVPPTEIESISATKIREQLKIEGKL